MNKEFSKSTKIVFIWWAKCVTSLLLLPLHASFAQNTEKLWEYAEEYYERKEYSSASEYYKRYLGKKEYKVKSLHRLVQCYRGINNSEEVLYYATLLKKKSTSDSSRTLYAEVMKEQGKYKAAKSEFYRLSTNNPSRSLYKELMASCDSSLLWTSRPSKSHVQPLTDLNTEYSEISPCPIAERMVFSSNREGMFIKKKSRFSGDQFYDLYESSHSRNTWDVPKLLSSQVNSVHHEFAPSFSPNGDTLYFTKSIDRTKATEDTVNRLKLYSSILKEGNWSQSQVFILNDSLFSFAHPFMDPSGKMFFFSSDMKGGYGGSDLYVCFKKDSLWSQPFNLGQVINSEANETYPFYTSGVLYFSSDHSKGMGGYDVYKAIQEKGDWTITVNLRPPLNSPSDDFALRLTADNKKGYFSSNRPKGKGKEDIYQITFWE